MIPENVIVSVSAAFDAYYQARSDKIMKNIHSWDGVLEFVFALNRELGGPLDDPSGIQDEINRVLEGKMSLTLLKAKIK